jgi:hypothetical protein
MGVKIKPQNPKTLRTHWSRAFPWPGTYEAPPRLPEAATWRPYRSRAGSRPGPMTSVISPEAVVPGASPGPMAILAWDLWPVFY